MRKELRILLGAGIVALFSQIYLDILLSDFRVTCGLIALGVFLYLNRDISPAFMGVAAAVSTFIWRGSVFILHGTFSQEVLLGFVPEIFFYIFYGIFIHYLVYYLEVYSVEKYFLLIVLGDFFANVFEILIRVLWYNHIFFGDILSTLIIVALFRSFVVVLCIIAIRYQRLLIDKEEHDKRYRKLLWLNSILRTEVFWMDKNMVQIEGVMTEAYQHFEAINANRHPHDWANQAVKIAGSVHEIKKEYELMLRGVKGVIETEYQVQAMTLDNVLSILEEKMKREAIRRNLNVRIIFQGGSTFYTNCHFELMSIFRNLINNAFDSSEASENLVTIRLNHWVEADSHIFQISDNGPGIDPNDLPFITEAGFSTKINYDTGQINRGLGLSIVKSIIVENLNGSLEISSIQNQKTSFDIAIPKSSLEVI